MYHLQMPAQMMDDNHIIAFGKFKGEKLANIPASYFIWLNKQDWCGKELKDYIQDNRDSFELEIKNHNDNN